MQGFFRQLKWSSTFSSDERNNKAMEVSTAFYIVIVDV